MLMTKVVKTKWNWLWCKMGPIKVFMALTGALSFCTFKPIAPQTYSQKLTIVMKPCLSRTLEPGLDWILEQAIRRWALARSLEVIQESASGATNPGELTCEVESTQVLPGPRRLGGGLPPQVVLLTGVTLSVTVRIRIVHSKHVWDQSVTRQAFVNLAGIESRVLNTLNPLYDQSRKDTAWRNLIQEAAEMLLNTWLRELTTLNPETALKGESL